AGEPVSSAVRSHDRGSESVHAAVEDQLSALPAHGKERAVARVQVRAVHRGDAVRTVSAGRCEMSRHGLLGLLSFGLAVAVPLGAQQPAAPKPAAKARSASSRTSASCSKSDVPPRTPWGDPDL